MTQANYVEIDGQFYSEKHPKALAARQRVARLPDPKRKSGTLSPLVRSQKKHAGRKRSVAICVAIVSYRNRPIDSDNLSSGAKPVRDAIARSLGLDDGDKRITWQYETIVTTGAVGTHVLISAK
jgi:hypothetical protein